MWYLLYKLLNNEKNYYLASQTVNRFASSPTNYQRLDSDP
jgi:YHS domain-containing protein